MADDSSETPAPAAATPSTPRRRAPRKAAAPKAASPRATKKASKPADAGAPPAKKPAAKRTRTTPAKSRSTARKPASRGEAAIEKVGGKWGAAAIAGGVAAIGAAATAALLTLRGSTPKAPRLPAPEDKKPAKAHQPDGTDSSKSFEAGIADENTVPEKA